MKIIRHVADTVGQPHIVMEQESPAAGVADMYGSLLDHRQRHKNGAEDLKLLIEENAGQLVEWRFIQLANGAHLAGRVLRG
jgi:hypothetical protein